MVRRRRKWRKRFTCGHIGYGRWCHRCFSRRPLSSTQRSKPANLISIQAAKARRLRRKQVAKCRWQASFQSDPIPLKHLPKPIVIKTRKILKALAQGTPPSVLKGKRFKFDRTLLRIPISYRYRLICRWQDGAIVPRMVLSHEDYNAVARNKKRVS